MESFLVLLRVWRVRFMLVFSLISVSILMGIFGWLVGAFTLQMKLPKTEGYEKWNGYFRVCSRLLQREFYPFLHSRLIVTNVLDRFSMNRCFNRLILSSHRI